MVQLGLKRYGWQLANRFWSRSGFSLVCLIALMKGNGVSSDMRSEIAIVIGTTMD